MQPAKQPYGFSEARFRCIKYMPYTYSHVASLIPVERPGLGTASVDRYMRVYYDPAMFADRPIDECTAAILHEDMHVLLRHFERAENYLGATTTPAQWQRWNEACDLTVNQSLRKAGLPIPEGWLLPERYGFAENLSTEEYYDLLQSQDEGPQGGENTAESDGENAGVPGKTQNTPSGAPDKHYAPGKTRDEVQAGSETSPANFSNNGSYVPSEQPEPGCGSGGSGADGQPRPWEAPPEDDGGPPEMSEYDQTMVERAVAEAIDQYEREKGQGTVPGSLSRMAAEILRPKVDPFKALHAAVKYAVTAIPGRGDYTWRRIPRRCPPGGLRLPAPIKPVPRATVIVDTSGSMGNRELAKALGVVRHGLRSVPAGGIRVLAGDTCVQSAQKVFRAEQVELSGGGGTNMGKLIEQAADQRPAPDAIVVVTDGFTPWPKSPVRPRVVACLTAEPNSDRHKVPEWITKVVLRD